MVPPKFLTCVLSRKPCPCCKGTIEVGEDAWPSKVSHNIGSRSRGCAVLGQPRHGDPFPLPPLHQSGYMHAACALDLEARGELVLQPPPCKHWARRGFCALHDEGRCFFSHPAQLQETVTPLAPQQPKQRRGQQRSQGHQAIPHLEQHHGTPSAHPAETYECSQQQGKEQTAGHVSLAAGSDVSFPSQPGVRTTTARRNRVRNRFRVSVFRRCARGTASCLPSGLTGFLPIRTVPGILRSFVRPQSHVTVCACIPCVAAGCWTRSERTTFQAVRACWMWREARWAGLNRKPFRLPYLVDLLSTPSLTFDHQRTLPSYDVCDHAIHLCPKCQRRC